MALLCLYIDEFIFYEESSSRSATRARSTYSGGVAVALLVTAGRLSRRLSAAPSEPSRHCHLGTSTCILRRYYLGGLNALRLSTGYAGRIPADRPQGCFCIHTRATLSNQRADEDRRMSPRSRRAPYFSISAFNRSFSSCIEFIFSWRR